MEEYTYSLSEISEYLEQLPEQFEHDPMPVTVTHNGKKVMIILSSHIYRRIQKVIAEMHETIESYQETLEVMHDSELMEVIRESVKDIEEGRGEPLDDVLKDLGWE